MCLHVCWGVAASLSHSAARGACGSPHPLVVLENKHVVLTRLTAKAPLRVHSDLLLGSLYKDTFSTTGNMLSRQILTESELMLLLCWWDHASVCGGKTFLVERKRSAK